MTKKAVADSILTKNQKKIITKEFKNENGEECKIVVTIRYDDQCGNGHNTFSITGDIREGWHSSGGCIHDKIEKYLPELSHLIKWHLCNSDGPLHYLANTLYHAGNRDHLGLLKDKKRQIINGKTKLPVWKLMAISPEGEEIDLYKLRDSVDSQNKPECPYTLEYRPWCHIGEGKERELDAARHSAIWPEATDEELIAPDLEQRLRDRLPALMKEFKEMVESLGFTY